MTQTETKKEYSAKWQLRADNAKIDVENSYKRLSEIDPKQTELIEIVKEGLENNKRFAKKYAKHAKSHKAYKQYKINCAAADEKRALLGDDYEKQINIDFQQILKAVILKTINQSN